MIEDRVTFGNLTDFPGGSATAIKIKKDGTAEMTTQTGPSRSPTFPEHLSGGVAIRRS
jgi:hypothetical protein